MAETLIKCNDNPDILMDPDPSPGTSSSGSSSLFHRRIEFHLARKPFTGFSNGGSGGSFQLETLNPTPASGLGPAKRAGVLSQPMSKKASDEVLENGLDPELSFRITFRKIGAGLENLGNTCFLNSVLQCLTYTEPLAAYLQSGKHQTSCRTSGFCALCAIQKHVSRALQSTGRILAPKDLVSNLRCISRNFRNARQEDAHEYMVNLLESMHKCCLPSGVPSESPSAYEKSLVHKIFGGRLRSQVKCMQCSFCSNKFDTFLDLSLEIMKADSLHKALAHFTEKEQLDGGERQYHCQQCKQKVRALKQLTIYKAPCVLTIHLKRFGSHNSGQKIDKKIHFGPTLDLKPFVTGPDDGDLKYTLYGVLVHAGWTTHSGHYFCFVRTSSGMWFCLDDNQVVQVSEKKVLEQKAYMLFYVRDRKALPSKKAVDVLHKERIIMNTVGNKPFSNFPKELKEIIQNGPIEDRLNVFSSSAGVAQVNAVTTYALKGTLMKEESSHKTHSLMVAKCLESEKAPTIDTSSKVSFLKDALKELSVPNSNGSEHQKLSASCAQSSSNSPGCGNAVITADGAEISGFDISSSTRKNPSDSVTIPSNCNGTLVSLAEKDLGEAVPLASTCNEKGNAAILPNGTTLQRSSIRSRVVEMTSSEKLGKKALIQDSGEKAATKIDPNSSSNQAFTEDINKENFSKECVDDDLEAKTSKLVHGKPQDNQPNRKKKKQAATMGLCSNIFLRKSLSLRKRKKHKRSKHRLCLLVDDCVSTDLGPSTTEKMVASDAACPRRKRMRSGSHKEDYAVASNTVTNSAGSLSVGITDDEIRIRTSESGTTLRIQSDAGELRSAHSRKDVGQNNLMNLLTRGLNRTVVARWDGIDLPPSEIERTGGLESVSIGYVADEWDEEYDRGKRKKVRNSETDFGGPNLFQEIATKKAKLKKARLDQSSSGNRPFRISQD